MKNDILKELYFGGVYPAKTIITGSGEFDDARREIDRLADELFAAVPEESKEFLRQMLTEQGKLSAKTELSAFESGFRLGVQIILESLFRE